MSNDRSSCGATVERCPFCDEPCSLCQCPPDAVSALMHEATVRWTEDGPVVKPLMLRTMAERAYAWGQQQSKSVLSETAATRLSSIEHAWAEYTSGGITRQDFEAALVEALWLGDAPYKNAAPPEVSAQDASEGLNGADGRCAKIPSATAGAAPSSVQSAERMIYPDIVPVPRDLLNAAACAINRDRWACSREGDQDGERAMIELHDKISMLLLTRTSAPSATGEMEREIWNKAIWAAVEECHRLEQKGKDNHRDSWMGNAMEAIGGLTRGPTPADRGTDG